MKSIRRTALSSILLLAPALSMLACDARAPLALTAEGATPEGATPAAPDGEVIHRRERATPRVDQPRALELAPVRLALPPGLALEPSRELRTLEGGGTCPTVSQITIGIDEPVDIVGSTIGASDTSKTFCADPSEETTAPDQMFEIVLPSDCTLTMSLESGEGFEGAFELQTGCAVKGEQLACVNGSNAEDLRLGLSAGTYYLIVDGANGTSGDFTVHATCAAPVCGDGVRNAATEACDGGPNATPGDGCIDAGLEGECQIESVAAADTCAETTPIFLGVGPAAVMPSAGAPYNSIGASSDYESVSELFWPAADQVFEFVAGATGTLKIRIGLDANGQSFCANDWFSPGCWNHVLYAREASCEEGAEIAMSYPNFMTDDGVNELLFPATEGVHYFVFVDGFDVTEYDAGPYYLDVELIAPE